MSAVPFVRYHLVENVSYLRLLTKDLMKDSDIFVREFSSLTLTELSRDPYGAAKLLEHCESFDFLVENLKLSDPDVKKNNIETTDNLLKDLTAPERFTSSQGFSFVPYYRLLEEPYPVIQRLALSVIRTLITRRKDDKIQQIFRNSGGLTVLLDMLQVRDNSTIY